MTPIKRNLSDPFDIDYQTIKHGAIIERRVALRDLFRQVFGKRF